MPFILAIVVVVGFCFGASAVWLFGAPAERPMSDLYISLQGDTVQIGTMESGWGPSSARGSALTSQVAFLSIPATNLRDRNFVVDIEMSGERSRKEPAVHVELSANKYVLGNFELDASRIKRLLLPSSAVYSEDRLMFKFVSRPKPTNAVLLRSITIRDVAMLDDVAGRLDFCKGGRFRGWAAASNGPAPLTVIRNGVQTDLVLEPVDRPDLVAAGFPPDAGFDFKLKDPKRPNEKVDLQLPNGKQLAGVECSS